MGFFDRFKKKRKVRVPREGFNKPLTFTPQPFDYHPKIILAWAKAIEGNEELLDYLWEQGYHELVMTKYAIFLKDKARDWLMENNYPHFMALIHAAEGNKEALNWLAKNKFFLFYNMALAIEGENKGFVWINKNSTREIFMLTKVIKSVKDEIEHEHNELHKRSRYT
ncbi:MAG: hypothetical protein WC994_07635 [Brumimicrobium sp.]